MSRVQDSSILDDISKTLTVEAETAKFANIPREILDEFHTDMPQDAASAAPEPIQRVQVPAADFRLEASPRTPPTFQAVPPENVARMDMNALFEAVRECVGCPLRSNRKNVVFGAGSANADLMFIGEGPGRDEDRQGVPFVGEAGQLLTKMINAMRFSRSEVFIANIIKCHPPGNRNPEDDEATACLPFLRRQIELVEPKVIVLLGAIALKYLMGRTGITRARGNWLDYNGIKVMPTFHPAYLLRNPSSKKDVWEDLQKVMAFFGKSRSPISGR
ncbi:MAG: uracil-DNA glycosylase [Kiritimatiellaeota bacterium]|nr:uracil-DNA glycosylase [Kiritimatiellota bacterium]